MKNKKYLREIIFLALGICTVIFVTKLIINDLENIEMATSRFSIFSIFLGIFLYFLSHMFRVFRLLVLSADSGIKIRSLAVEQIKANGVNLMVPFRLGESYRLIVFKKFFHSYSNSFAILLSERFLDIILITSILFLASFFSDIEMEFLQSLMYISISLLLIIVLMYFSLDQLLLIVHKIFLGKKTNSMNLSVIKFTSSLIKVLKNTKNILTSKLASCLLITIIIWVLEILVFYVLFSFLDLSNFVIILLSICVVLSSLLPSGPAGYGGIQLAFYLVGLSIGFEELVFYSFAYNFYIFGIAILISGLFFLSSFFIELRGSLYESRR